MSKFALCIVILAALAVAHAAPITIRGNNAHYTAWDATDSTSVAKANHGKLGFEAGKLSQGCVTFKIQGSNDAHILLTSEHAVTNPNEESYEVLLGGWKNTKSVIRVGKDGEVLDSFPKNKWMNGAVLSTNEKRGFWICMVDGEISVGRGLIIYANGIMTFTGLKGSRRRHDNIQYISFAAWDNALTVSDIDMHHAKSKMMEFMAPGNGRLYRVWNRPNQIRFTTANQFEMVFRAKGDAATVAFMPEESEAEVHSIGVTSERAIEIILDAGNGTKTEIYYGNKATGSAVLLNSFKTHDLVDFYDYRAFWIRKWGRAIIVGKGETVGRNAIAWAKIPSNAELSDRSAVGFSALDFPTAYVMVSSEEAPMMSEDEMEKHLDNYFDAITENKMETAMIAGGAKFHNELYEAWQKATGEKNLNGEDQEAWEQLQWDLAAQGNPQAIAILTGTAVKPTPPKETKAQWEADSY